jgi:hypothetical protein
MRRLMVLMLLGTNLAHAQLNACVPTFDPASLERVSVATQRCGLHLQSYLYEAGSELRGRLSIGFDANDALRIAQNDMEAPFTMVFPGAITHTGRDGDTIYWGIWGASASSRSTMPYLAGVESRSLPTGVARYSLAGTPFIVSGENNAYAPVPRADNLGNPIAPGPITHADLEVDFGAGTATLNLRFAVRGVTGDAVIRFERLTLPSLDFESVDCAGMPHCSTAELKFYGRGATHAGVLLTVYYESVMPKDARVAAVLTNVSGQSAIGLRRR